MDFHDINADAYDHDCVLAFLEVFYQKKLTASTVFVFPALEEISGFKHAFTLRQPGSSVKDANALSEVAPSHRVLLKELGLKIDQLIMMEQVHSDRVVMAPPDPALGRHRMVGPADGVITTGPGQFPVVRTADCIPLLLVHPAAGRLCVVHAGWRGTLAGITSRGGERLLEVAGGPASQLIAALGPCIRSCCYQVGDEVRERYREAGYDLERIFRQDHLDLVEVNRVQLERLGVTRILDCRMCTACRTDLFHSYRREGETGRNWALAGFQSRSF